MIFWSFLKKIAAGLFLNEMEMNPIIDKGIEYGKGNLTKKSTKQNTVSLFFKTGTIILVLDASLENCFFLFFFKWSFKILSSCWYARDWGPTKKINQFYISPKLKCFFSFFVFFSNKLLKGCTFKQKKNF